MAQMWNAVKRRVGGEVNQFLENLNADLRGGFEEEGGGALGLGLGGGGLSVSGAGSMAMLGGGAGGGARSPGRGAAYALDDGEGPMEEGYRAALVRFQLDQIKVTKEYQTLLGEKEEELARLRARYEADTGKPLPEELAPVPGGKGRGKGKAGGGGGITEIGREEGEDPMRAYQGLTADQLRAQVEVLLDSIASWEARVGELVGSRAELAGQAEQMALRVERAQLKMGDLVDRVKLQQTELERYIGLAEEYRRKTKADGETVEALLRDYTRLVAESQGTEQRLARRAEELEVKNDELKTKLKAYERNILQLIDTQAELAAKQGAGAGAASAAASDSAAVGALQRQLLEKEEEIKRLMQASSTVQQQQQAKAEADPELVGKLAAAEAEAERLRKELDGARKSLEGALKLGEKLQREVAGLRTRQGEEERAEAALREEVTELQAKLEAAYKQARHELALAKDKAARLEAQLGEATAAGKAQAMEEARAALQPLVEQLRQERAEALALYAEENRKRKLVHNKLLELQGNIRVLCRVRPVLPVEVAAEGGRDVTEYPTPEDIVITREDRSKARFEFDRVFAPGSTQAEVFEAVAPICTSFMDGYNACIFAYGQTGSGKTHTMEGPPDDRGVNFRALAEVFRLRQERADSMRYTIHLSMLEIYNETVRDLLGPREAGSGKDGGLPKLEIRMAAEGEFDVPGLTLLEVTSMEEVVKHMNTGKQNRAVGAHDMNEHSSRSHSILSLRVRGENVHDRSIVVSKLHLIDLAGSERLSKTDAQGERLKEAQNINKSLSALGDVIQALAAKSAKGGSNAAGHVPFRNSKLTFLLQDSLGGNSKVLMFVNISPAAYNCGETVCSLTFAGRCRNVQLGAAKKNTNAAGGGGDGGEVARLREQVERLQEELAAALAKGGGSSGSGGGASAPSTPMGTTARGAAGLGATTRGGGVGRTPPSASSGK